MMFHKETYQYREPEGPRAIYEKDRLMAASQIILATVDYHKAKQLIVKKKVNFDRYFKLPNMEKKIILAGKSAHEWLTRSPRKNGSGWTLDACCELLGLDPERIRDGVVSPEVFRKYKKLAPGLGSSRHPEKRQATGADNPKSKLTKEQAEQIRNEYSTGIYTHRMLAKKYNVGVTNIGRVVRKEAYA